MCMTTTFYNIAYRIFIMIKNTDNISTLTDELNAAVFQPRNEQEER